ncbi:MAG: hypothetical protein JSV20_02915 [Candidatus Bathyarchaeota archaeon]|nr:MAG: hypothetical protein JSV20_02915 [Candidatus Bathyarchaeota archaeon]
MPETMRDFHKKRDEKEKEEAIDILTKQLETEYKLVSLYEETEKAIKSSAVRHLLHMIQLDSKKHIDICQLVIDILQGEEVLKEEKEDLKKGLQRHIELENEALEKANKLLRNVWIREIEGLQELVKKWRSDEKEHHKALKKLAEKPFIRISERDFFSAFKTTEELEERYRKTYQHRKQSK